MKFQISIDREKIRDRGVVSSLVRRLLESLVEQNCVLIASGAVPRIYSSGVRYVAPSLDENETQNFKNCVETFEARKGSCPELAAWRAAELRKMGDSRIGVRACRYGASGQCVAHPKTMRVLGRLLPGCPGVKIYWRPGTTVYHCEVRLPSGDAEDPSRFLGMKGPNT